MKYGIVSCGEKAYFQLGKNAASPLIDDPENSETISIWKAALQDLGLDPDDHGLMPEHLFDLMKDSFEKKFGCKLNVTIDRKFIASLDGESPIRHDDSSRIFAGNGVVYIDELMVSIIFEYVANYYIWARYGDEVFSFCFPYALNSMNYCCRQGFLNSDKNKAELSKTIKTYCDDVAIVFISDLYWSILGFAFCHELAHIYLGHDQTNHMKHDQTNHMKTVEELREDEFSADAIGFDVFLSIIDGKIEGLKSPFLACFHDYLYAAPIILFLFYQDLYFMEYWLFGETINNDDHPSFEERINRLLELSENERYQFDTSKGNDVLNNYWDMSEKFRIELFYKLKNGKLGHVIQKGTIPMDNSFSYNEAIAFDNQMRNEVKELAKEQGIDPNIMAGLYDIATRVEKHDDKTLMHFVWSKGESVYSTKPFNVIFRLKATILSVIDGGLSLSIPDNKTKTIMLVLRLLLKLLKNSTIKITKDQANVLLECHKKNAYIRPIEEDELLNRTSVPQKTIDDLCALKCIELVDGKIWLKENIWL